MFFLLKLIDFDGNFKINEKSWNFTIFRAFLENLVCISSTPQVMCEPTPRSINNEWTITTIMDK